MSFFSQGWFETLTKSPTPTTTRAAAATSGVCHGKTGEKSDRIVAPERRIEDYALIGDGRSAALVSIAGSIDWMCWPHMDSKAMFCALLGNQDNGHWSMVCEQTVQTQRQYLEGTMILETIFETPNGAVRILDWFATDTRERILFRRAECLRGSVTVTSTLLPRYDYGSIRPWIHQTKTGYRATAGPDCVEIQSDQDLNPNKDSIESKFSLAAGQTADFKLIWEGFSGSVHVSHRSASVSLRRTTRNWRKWLAQSIYKGPHQNYVSRSLLTLKALVDVETGAVIAAPTTSLPELIGGERNWDYRFCWIRDATYTLFVFLTAGYTKEAEAWRNWLVRTVAGTPEKLNIMYSLRGDRRLTELAIEWLPGFNNSAPVRIGNGAYTQRQLDIYGELMDTLHLARNAGLEANDLSWEIQKDLLKFLDTSWREPDEGIWESRGEPQRYTYSQVMAWVAFDRAIRDAEKYSLDGPVEHWREVRAEIHAEVCEKGYNPKLKSFTQYFGSSNVDASLLLMLHVGFLPPDDPRVLGTITLVEKSLLSDGFVRRYVNSESPDGLDGSDATFLPCSFWLVDAYVLSGQRRKAVALFEKLLSVSNDLGLFSEEYDPLEKRLLGNFPQALTHLSLVNSAFNLYTELGPAHQRSQCAYDS